MVQKQRKLSIRYRQLQTSCNIEVVGSVPAKQVYQADLKEYTPDYSITPLTLYPRCNATDPDNVNKVGVVNASLTNMKWYEVVGGTKTLITSSTEGYSIVSDGTTKGQITVSKNVSTLQAVTLEFYAEYIDSRTGSVHVFQMSQLVMAIDGTAALPTLLVDSPNTEVWNPVRQTTTERTINFKVVASDIDVTDRCLFFVYRLLDTGALELISDGSGDNDWEYVSKTDTSYTFDLNYIGDEITYVVKATYDADGSPSTNPDDSVLEWRGKFVRRIPKLWCDWEGVPNEVANGTTLVYPKPIVTDTLGNIDLPEDMFRFFWYTSTDNGSTWELAADIKYPSIPFVDGMLLKLEVVDRGAYCVVTDANGNVVCTGDVPIIVRKNG